MSKLNPKTTRVRVRAPLQTESAPSGRTALGHPGYARDIKTELYTLGVSNFVREDTAHENAVTRDDRFTGLVRELAITDPSWLTGFLHWLRTEGSMRSASVLAGCEGVAAMHEKGIPGGRQLIDGVMARADEPGDAWAYWLQEFGRKAPHAFQRGLADGVFRLYSERSLLRYDSPEAGLRFGDVIELSRPRYNHREYGGWRDALYRYAIMRRHDREFNIERDGGMLISLPKISAARLIFAMPKAERRAFLTGPGGVEAISDAGIKWESVAGWLEGPMDAAAWEACIPSMGIFAHARNLRNFDNAGVSDLAIAPVIAEFTDPQAVAASRMFPFRWLAAYRHAPSLRWSYPLERALNLSLTNVPSLAGNTLILADRSPSMWQSKMSDKSDMYWADGAAIFAAALAVRAHKATLAEFSGTARQVKFSPVESVLKIVERLGGGPAWSDYDTPGKMASGTDIPRAVHENLSPEHDRVVIITDEQTRAGYLPSNMHGRGAGHYADTEIDTMIPAKIPVYMWNIGGYQYGAVPTGPNRHLFAGITDGAFRQLAALERGADADWPWVE